MKCRDTQSLCPLTQTLMTECTQFAEKKKFGGHTCDLCFGHCGKKMK